VLRRSEGTRFSSRSDDEVGGTKARSGRSERSERSNQAGIARRRAEEERGDTLFVRERRRSRRHKSAIWARDVRAADLQEEPTKRIKMQS